MRRWLLVVTVGLLVSCASHTTPAPMPIQRFVFVETLPDYVQVCVRRNPFVDDLVCLSLGEFRQIARNIRRASLP